MKKSLITLTVSISIGLASAQNPFDLNNNLKKIDQDQNTLLEELKKLADKHEAVAVPDKYTNEQKVSDTQKSKSVQTADCNTSVSRGEIDTKEDVKNSEESKEIQPPSIQKAQNMDETTNPPLETPEQAVKEAVDQRSKNLRMDAGNETAKVQEKTNSQDEQVSAEKIISQNEKSALKNTDIIEKKPIGQESIVAALEAAKKEMDGLVVNVPVKNKNTSKVDSNIDPKVTEVDNELQKELNKAIEEVN